MGHQNLHFKTLLENTSVIPVLDVKSIDQGISVARALTLKGYSVLEITLRTDCAFDAIEAIKRTFPETKIGVGTVLDKNQFYYAHEIGVDFAVSPGATEELIEAANNIPLPYLPGVATASEAMKLRSIGYRYLKLFPAEAIGGLALLKSLYGPLSDIMFCPTGGINEQLSEAYLSLPNVVCVGGSWMTK